MSLGLTEMVERSSPEVCPFCGEPRAQRVGDRGRPPLSCLAPECRAAYHVFYGRDRRRRERAQSAERSGLIQGPSLSQNE